MRTVRGYRTIRTRRLHFGSVGVRGQDPAGDSRTGEGFPPSSRSDTAAHRERLPTSIPKADIPCADFGWASAVPRTTVHGPHPPCDGIRAVADGLPVAGPVLRPARRPDPKGEFRVSPGWGLRMPPPPHVGTSARSAGPSGGASVRKRRLRAGRRRRIPAEPVAPPARADPPCGRPSRGPANRAGTRSRPVRRPNQATA